MEKIEILSTGIDLESRRIYWGGECAGGGEHDAMVTTANVEHLMRCIDILARDSKFPISLYMSSQGGDPYEGLRAYDHIRACECPVRFYGSGSIMSAAVVIMLACDHRALYPNATVMIHDGSAEVEGSQEQIDIQVKEFARLDRIYNEIYAERSFLSVDDWSELARKDVYLSAGEALTLGLVDEVLTFPDKRELELKRSRRTRKVGTLLKGIKDRTK